MGCPHPRFYRKCYNFILQMWQTSHTLKGSTISQQCSLPLSRFYHAFRNWLGWNRATSCRDSCTKVTCWRKVCVHDTRQTRQVTLSVCPFYSFIRDSFIAGAARVWSKLVCKICNEIKLHRARRLPKKKHTHTTQWVLRLWTYLQ